MQIKLNGTPHTLAACDNVAALVQQLALEQTQVAIEKNREIVPRSRWAEAALAEGDEIEIVRFVGGG